MSIDFAGYAVDCRIFGRVPNLGERLTDLLNEIQQIVVRDASLVSLADGRRVEMPTVTVRMDELYAAVGNGPRGWRDQRVKTEPHRLQLQAGPYLVLGQLHTPPEADPIRNVLRRQSLVPLTNATIVYKIAGEVQAEDVPTLIVNRLFVEWIRPTADEEEAFPDVPVRMLDEGRRRVKDFTGTFIE